jgi:hypothetical protein
MGYNNRMKNRPKFAFFKVAPRGQLDKMSECPKTNQSSINSSKEMPCIKQDSKLLRNTTRTSCAPYVIYPESPKVAMTTKRNTVYALLAMLAVRCSPVVSPAKSKAEYYPSTRAPRPTSATPRCSSN